MRNLLPNDPLIKTFTSPREVIVCEPVTLFSLLYLLPSVLLAALLYPPWAHLRSLRFIRLLLLMPISIYLSLRLPIDYCFIPTTRRGYPNLALACASFIVAARSFHWGCLTNYKHGNIHKRPEFQLSSSSIKTSHPLHSDKKILALDQKQHQISSCSFDHWLAWTLELLSSPRGVQYAWGIKAAPSREGPIDIIKRMYKMNLIHLIAVTFSTLARDHGSPKGALRHLIGMGGFYGESMVAEGLANLAFGYFLISQIDLMYGYLTLLVHLVTIINRRVIRLPVWLMTSLDPRTCVPMFNRPYASKSLAILWGKAWHQNFRQTFLICGGNPAASLARLLGFSSHIQQRLATMIGCFFVSAILHEYALHFIARAPHPNAHILYHEFPGSALYFMLQPIGILMEPYLAPYVPGGGVVVTYVFTLVTTTPFRRQYFTPGRLLDHSYPPFSYTWLISSLLIPGFSSRG